MDRLGEDEIFCIYERITNQVDKESFSKVCKKFLKVAGFNFRLLQTESPDLLYHMLTSSPKMSWFECHVPLSNNHMKLIAESCPNIKHLDLSLSKYPDHQVAELEFDDVGLCAIASACIHMDHVNLYGRLHIKEIGIGALVRSCKNLELLNLENCANVSDKSLNMIGEATRLKVLCLSRCYSISDLGLEYLANGDLRYCLEALELDKCDRITDNGIVHLKKLVSLRSLSLCSCGANITDHGVVALCELPNLETLDLHSLTSVTDISLLEIGSKCLKMSELSLTGCKRITNVGLHGLFGHQRLSQLSIFSCYRFSWEAVKSLALSCPNLRYVGLSRKRKKRQISISPAVYINNHHFQIEWV